MSSITETFIGEKDGFKLYSDLTVTQGISRITKGTYSVRVGQLVTASGRFLVPKGTKGLVTSIVMPGEEQRTSNVIAVWFEGLGKANFMKFKDLELKPY